MFTLRDLISNVTEMQGEVVVRQYNYDTDEFDVEAPLSEIPKESAVWGREITYMYADYADIRNRADAPVLFIEVSGDLWKE